jgi:hypothetical protein
VATIDVNAFVAKRINSWVNGARAFAHIVLTFVVGFAAFAVAVWLARFIPGVSITSGYAETLVFGACAWAAKDLISQTARSVI